MQEVQEDKLRSTDASKPSAGALKGDPNFDEVTIQTWLVNQNRPKNQKEITLEDISIDLITEAFANVEMLGIFKEESPPLIHFGH